jgi:hypothetical protein
MTSQKGFRRFVPENDLLDPTLAITKMLEARNELGLIYGSEINFTLKSAVFVLALVVCGFIFNFYIPNVLEIILITLAALIAVILLVEAIRILNRSSENLHILGVFSTLIVIFILVSILGFL